MKKLKIAMMHDGGAENPYLSLLSGALRGLGHEVLTAPVCSPRWLWANRTSIDVLHFHWVQYFYKSPGVLSSSLWSLFFFLRLLLAKMLSYRIVWTVHNIMPHERCPGPSDLIARRSLALFADALVVHCRRAESLVREAFGRRNGICVIPHGHYIGWYSGEPSREEARRCFQISAEEYVYLYFGAIKPYKGLEGLIGAFKQLPSGILIIAGRPDDPAIEKALRERIGGHPGIRFLPGFVPDDQVRMFFQCCDAVVLPFSDVLTSGSAVLALSLGRPVIVPDLGCLPELVSAELGLLFNPGGWDSLRKALIEIRSRSYHAGQTMDHMEQRYGWRGIAGRHLAAYGVGEHPHDR